MPPQIHPVLTTQILLDYSKGALSNANDLLKEAKLLLEAKCWARAYFLAVNAIEETGNALQCFDSTTRNLRDGGIRRKIRIDTEDHAKKITYALVSMAMNSADVRSSLQTTVDLSVQAKRGREASLYSDLRIEPNGVQLPVDIVRPVAATDCVRLAAASLLNAATHLSEKEPLAHNPASDRLFTMKTAQFQSLLKNADFWWYYISRMEGGDRRFAEALLEYERRFGRKGVLFRKVSD